LIKLCPLRHSQVKCSHRLLGLLFHIRVQLSGEYLGIKAFAFLFYEPLTRWRKKLDLQKRLDKAHFHNVRHINSTPEPSECFYDLGIIVLVDHFDLSLIYAWLGPNPDTPNRRRTLILRGGPANRPDVAQ